MAETHHFARQPPAERLVKCGLIIPTKIALDWIYILVPVWYGIRVPLFLRLYTPNHLHNSYPLM